METTIANITAKRTAIHKRRRALQHARAVRRHCWRARIEGCILLADVLALYLCLCIVFGG